MTKRDRAIWAKLKRRSAVARVAHSYITGEFWLRRAMGGWR